MKTKRWFLDLEDSASRIPCNPVTLRRYVREGKIKPLPGGPPYFFDIETIKRFPKPKVGRPREKGGETNDKRRPHS